MKLSIKAYFLISIFLLAIVSCQKKSKIPPYYCDFPGDVSDLHKYRFTIRDGAYRNLLKENKLSLSHLQITQLCTEQKGRVVDADTNGVFGISISQAMNNGISCNRIYFKWDDNDTDTLDLYDTYNADRQCGEDGLITDSFLFNNKKVLIDTFIGDPYIYTLRK